MYTGSYAVAAFTVSMHALSTAVMCVVFASTLFCHAMCALLPVFSCTQRNQICYERISCHAASPHTYLCLQRGLCVKQSQINATQASWVTVREALRQLQGAGSSVTSSEVVQLSYFCPLLLNIGDKEMMHMSWSTRASHTTAPDAADVVKKAAAQQSGPSDSGCGNARNATATTHMQSKHDDHIREATQGCTHSSGDGGSRMASAAGDAVCGSFLVECPTNRAVGNAPTLTTERSTCGRTVVTQVPEHDAQVNSETNCRNAAYHSQLQGRPAMDQPEQIQEQAADFEIHLEDAPRHVPPAANYTKPGNKPPPSIPKGQRSNTRSGPAKLDESKKSQNNAQLASREECSDAAVPTDMEEEPDVMEQGLPAFAAGSHARRHAAAFRRCIVQAVALLQQACIPEGSTGDAFSDS